MDAAIDTAAEFELPPFIIEEGQQYGRLADTLTKGDPPFLRAAALLRAAAPEVWCMFWDEPGRDLTPHLPKSFDRPALVLITAPATPSEWVSVAAMKAWAARIVLTVDAKADLEFYAALPDEARTVRRLLVVETTAEHLGAWAAALFGPQQRIHLPPGTDVKAASEGMAVN